MTLRMKASDPRFGYMNTLNLQLNYLKNPDVHYNVEKLPDLESKLVEQGIKDDIQKLIVGEVERCDN